MYIAYTPAQEGSKPSCWLYIHTQGQQGHIRFRKSISVDGEVGDVTLVDHDDKDSDEVGSS